MSCQVFHYDRDGQLGFDYHQRGGFIINIKTTFKSRIFKGIFYLLDEKSTTFGSKAMKRIYIFRLDVV